MKRKQPFHGDESDNRGDQRSKQNQSPNELTGLAQCRSALKSLRPPAASKVGMPSKNENSVAAGPAQPEGQGDQDRRAGTRSARECGGGEAAPDRPLKAICQVIFWLDGLPTNQRSITTNSTPPINIAQAIRRQVMFREFEMEFFHRQAAEGSDKKRSAELRQIILRDRVAPARQQLFHSCGKHQQHRQHCPALDDDVEKIVFDQVQAAFGASAPQLTNGRSMKSEGIP